MTSCVVWFVNRYGSLPSSTYVPHALINHDRNKFLAAEIKMNFSKEFPALKATPWPDANIKDEEISCREKNRSEKSYYPTCAHMGSKGKSCFYFPHWHWLVKNCLNFRYFKATGFWLGDRNVWAVWLLIQKSPVLFILWPVEVFFKLNLFSRQLVHSGKDANLRPLNNLSTNLSLPFN